MKKIENFNKTTNKTKLDQAGMTLIEIMIVVGIIATLMAVIGNGVRQNQRKSKISLAKIKINKVKDALELFYSDCGQYPDTLTDLINQPSEDVCDSWGPESYIQNERELKDPWKTLLVYAPRGGDYDLKSLGENKQEGGETRFDKDITAADL